MSANSNRNDAKCFMWYKKCIKDCGCCLPHSTFQTKDTICKSLIWGFSSILCGFSLISITLSIAIMISLIKYSSFNSSRECKSISHITRNLSHPITFSHRGYIDDFPGNTFQSIIKSYQLNMSSEMDLWLTSDDRFVLSHDGNIYEKTGIDRSIPSMTYSEISQVKIKNTINGVSYKNYTKFPVLSTTLNSICTISNIESSPYILLDIKFSSDNWKELTTEDQHGVDLMLNVISNSTCRHLSFLTIFVASDNVQNLEYIERMWSNTKYNISAKLFTILWLFPNLEFGIYFWLKTRLRFLFVSTSVDSIGLQYEAMVANSNLLNSYRNRGYCVATYMEAKVNYYGYNISDLTERYHPHVFVMNRNETKWNEILSNAIDSGSEYNVEQDMANYIIVVCMVTICWIIGISICGVLLYGLWKEYTLCCCSKIVQNDTQVLERPISASEIQSLNIIN